MMEYQAVIKIGRSAMKVLFTDGSMNAMGLTPATYTTDDPMVQHAIENSDQYRKGRIRIVRSIPLGEEVYIVRNKREERPIEAPNAEPESAADGGEAVKAEDAPAEAAGASPALTEMEFDNNDDARDFLEAKFGYVRSKLRNRADIEAAGASNGIAIIFT